MHLDNDHARITRKTEPDEVFDSWIVASEQGASSCDWCGVLRSLDPRQRSAKRRAILRRGPRAFAQR
jgi:hypothetical protein